MKIRFALTLMAMIASAGCATHARRTTAARNFDVITREQLVSNHFQSAYDAVVSLHANWLQAHSLGPLVYFNDVRLGGIETLRTINLRTVAYIQHHDALSASTRWGPGHASGVIYIATHPVVTSFAR